MSGAQLLADYCAAIDRREDAGGIAERFWSEDGVLDNTAIGSPLVHGRGALTAAYEAMFGSMAELRHDLSGAHENADGSVDAQVAATGRPVGGEAFAMAGTYRMETTGEGEERRIARLTFTPASRG